MGDDKERRRVMKIMEDLGYTICSFIRPETRDEAKYVKRNY